MEDVNERLDRVMRAAESMRHMLLATVDETGTPRLTPVEQCTRAGEGRVTVRAWIDVPPLENRGGRSRLSLALWDEQGNGYQLTGHAIRALDAAVLDGFTEIEEQVHSPQVERDILMQVESIEEFHMVGLPIVRP